MLTSSNQYIRPEYLTPLSNTVSVHVWMMWGETL